MELRFKWAGFKEFEELLTEITDDFGEKDSRKILRNACRDAMKPVLATARGLLETHGNIETGQLLASLQLEARKPNRRDKHSKYSSPTMVMISRITVPSGQVLARRRFRNRKTNKVEIGMNSDGRAFAIEFGTAKWKRGEGMPFLRPAMERNAQVVTDSLSRSLQQALIKYRSKHMRTK